MTKRNGTPLRQVLRITIVLVALLLVGIALAVRPRSRGPTNRPDSLSRSRADALPSPEVLDSSLRAIAAGESTLARDRWDPAWLASRLGPDPERARAWVKTYTAWIPYRGTLRGPAGVLMDRQGNALDRALLLAALLRTGGHTVRLAHADLGGELALNLLPGLVALRRGAGLPWVGVDSAVDWRPSVRGAARRFGLDADRIEESLARRLDSTTDALDALDRRTVDQTRRLLALMPGRPRPRYAARVDRYLDALRDHWWVQRLDSGGWVDLDLLPASSGQPHLKPLEVVEVVAVPDSLYHRVVVRLVTERWAEGTVAEQVAFQAELKPSEVIGLPVGLQVWPSNWPAEVLPPGPDPRAAVRRVALEQAEWRATLMVGKDALADVMLDETGGVRGAAAGGPMGGLGRGIVGALGGDRPNGSILSAAWLDYEIRVPGESPHRERRVLFDLPGPAARASKQVPRPVLDESERLIRSLALMRETDLLVLGNVPDPEFVLHLAAAATQTNAGLARDSRAADSGGAPGAWMAVAARTAPIQRLYAMALARFAWDTRGELFLARPNVLSQHDFLAPVPEGITRIRANDIVANDVAVALDVEDEVGTRVGQGVRDTNGEALFPVGALASGSVAAAFSDGEWLAIASLADTALARLRVSDNTRQRMIEELSTGHVLVVPSHARTGDDIVGWWRIDPVSGQTLGVSPTGWGQTLLERAVEYGETFYAAWAFEYLDLQVWAVRPSSAAHRGQPHHPRSTTLACHAGARANRQVLDQRADRRNREHGDPGSHLVRSGLPEVHEAAWLPGLGDGATGLQRCRFLAWGNAIIGSRVGRSGCQCSARGMRARCRRVGTSLRQRRASDRGTGSSTSSGRARAPSGSTSTGRTGASSADTVRWAGTVPTRLRGATTASRATVRE